MATFDATVRLLQEGFRPHGQDGVAADDCDVVGPFVFDESGTSEESGDGTGTSRVDGAADESCARKDTELGGDELGGHKVGIGECGERDDTVEVFETDLCVCAGFVNCFRAEIFNSAVEATKCGHTSSCNTDLTEHYIVKSFVLEREKHTFIFLT